MRARAARVLGVLLSGMIVISAVSAARAVETVTLARRDFAPSSPAAAFQGFVAEARKLAASTTTAWGSTESGSDLSAWGPALVFPLLDRGVASGTIVGLAAPLEAEGTAPRLMFRTLGLYAAKARAPFVDTPTLMQAIRRNLRTIEHATGDLDALTSARELSSWGSIGAAAWLAYLELLYKEYADLGHPGEQRWPAAGVRILDELQTRAPLVGGKGFRRDPRDAEVTLWPNALAIYAFVKGYENEEAVRYESAAIGAAEAVEALRGDDGSYVSSPTDQTSDARANAYLAGGLLLLFKDTGDTRYRDRAVGIIRWLTQGPGAAASARDADLSAHAAYLVLLLDSVSAPGSDTILGRRPMRLTADRGGLSRQAIEALVARLRPSDFRYREMFDAVLHTLLERAPFTAGDFAYDYGDAPGYAATVLFTGGDTAVAPQIVRREVRLLRWPRPRDFDEIAFGADGLLAALDHAGAADRAAAEQALRRYLALSGALAIVDRYYFDWLDWLTGGGGFEYGPTVIGAQIAGTHLRYAERLPGQTVIWFQPLHIGTRVLTETDHLAWDADRRVYRARLGSDVTTLLPNAMMILDLLQAYNLTKEASYVTRAEETVAGLEVLRDNERGAYYASGEQTGENGYESLSTNSYAALALLRLAQVTGKSEYRDRALSIFDFIQRDLYADGVVFHHIYRGRRASGDLWCSGCNWRVLAELMELAAK